MNTWADTHLNIPSDHPDAERLKQLMVRKNPEYEAAVRLGFATHGIDPYIHEYREAGGRLKLPRSLWPELTDRARVEDRTEPGEPANLGREIKLRDYQVEPVAEAVRQLRNHQQGVVLQAVPGAGKTLCSLEVARRVGTKTIVLVHKSFLLNQWRDRIKTFLGIDAGVVWQDTNDTDAPIVIAMAQTLSSRTYSPEWYSQFGLVICDETHRFSAPTFSEAIVNFPARWRLGVTATPERADGLEWVFQAHIGPVGVTMHAERVDPEVYVIPTPLNTVVEGPLMSRGKPDYVKMITFLTESEARNRQIIEHTLDAAKNGRNIVVFSDRRKHLEVLAEMFAAGCNERGMRVTHGFYVGGMKEEELAVTATRQVLFSTYAMAAEGLDIPKLDTCIMTTPKSTIIQTVGRIQRTMEGKPQPVVLDFVDQGIGISRGLARRRQREYEEQGWPVNDWTS